VLFLWYENKNHPLLSPDCQSAKIKKNGSKKSQKQNYLCKNCSRQFIGDHALSYKGCQSELNHKILLMPARGVGIRDVAKIEKVSIILRRCCLF
jgi:transposase-like protein